MREPTFEGQGYNWFYNDSTGLGEIQVQSGAMGNDRSVAIALSADRAKQFHKAPPANHGAMIQAEYKLLMQKRASRRP